MNIRAFELTGFTSASRLAEPRFYRSIIDLVRRPLEDVFEEECSPIRRPSNRFEGVFHAVLYLIPPSSVGLTPFERELLTELQEMTMVIPILTKADMYTMEELQTKKTLVERLVLVLFFMFFFCRFAPNGAHVLI